MIQFTKIILFSLLAVLSIVLISNVFITLWIMTAIGFSSSGLPSLKVGSKHLHAQGDIFAMKSLFASRIMDYNGLIVQAFKNLSLVANSDRRHSSAMFLNENEVIVASKRFVIMNTNGDTIFSTSPEETAMTARKMRLSGTTYCEKYGILLVLVYVGMNFLLFFFFKFFFNFFFFT